MENKTLIIKYSIFLVLIILISNFVLAWGVATPYWRGYPLKMAPGETASVVLGLQNMASDEDVTVEAKLTNGEQIVSMENKVYTIKAGTKDTGIPLKVTIPSNATLNTSYPVTISFKTVTPGIGGGVVMGTGIDTNFEVLVIAGEIKPTAGNTTTILIIAGIVIIIIIIILILIKRRRR